MAKGKFSGPRPYREEERQIEEAFRQVTEPGKPSHYTPSFPPNSTPQPEDLPFGTLPPEEDPLPTEELPEDLSQEPAGRYEEDAPSPAAGKTRLDKLMTFVEENRKLVLVGACGLVLVLIITFLAIFLGSGSDPYNSKILSNVTVAGVNLGGLTKSQATQVVKNTVAPLYTSQDMTVQLGASTLTLSPADTGAELKVKEAVNAAYSYGRTGTKAEKQAAYTSSFTEVHTIALLPYLKLDTDYIQSALSQYAATVGSTLTQPSYTLEGATEELGTDVFDPDTAQPLTLVVTMGTPGVDFQQGKLYDAILDAYSLGSFQVSWEQTDADALPDVPDMAAVLLEMGKEPVDDSVDLQTFQTIPGSYGYTFDVESAQAMVDSAQYGQILRIPMTYVAPERMGEDALSQDVLGRGRTSCSGNESRLTNLRLACQALDGQVIKPGESFSFNDTVGSRTTDRGYVSATSHTSRGNAVGGGVSQVASTLYYAALTADLEITERHSHKLEVSYIDPGLDAAVTDSWDLRLKNNTNFPIRISAKVESSQVVVELLGTDEKDYTISLSYTVVSTAKPETEYVDYEPDNAKGYKDGDVITNGSSGSSVQTYKNKYDKQTGAVLSKDFITTTVYQSVTKVVARVRQTETQPTTQPTLPEESTDTGSGTGSGEGTGSGGDAGTDSGTGGSGSTGGSDTGTSGSGGTSGGDTGTGGNGGTGGGDTGTSGSDSTGGSDTGTGGSGGSDSGSGSSDTGTSGSGGSTPAPDADTDTPEE